MAVIYLTKLQYNYTFYGCRKNKSRQGITIRKNKQPVSIDQSSNSHLNRTDSAHSNNVRSASNMIPCFPANNSTDVHHCVTWYQVFPRHLILQRILLLICILPKSEPGQLSYKKIKPLLGKSKRILSEK